MGYYINPTDCTKEEWLEKNALEISGPAPWDKVVEGNVQVCWVDNGPFTAAGVMYSRDELVYWMIELADDSRPRKWYLTTLEAVEKVTTPPLKMQTT